MLTLILVAALCDVNGCTYMDATRGFDVRTDEECAQTANFANFENIKNGKDARFACLMPSKYKELVSREI